MPLLRSRTSVGLRIVAHDAFRSWRVRRIHSRAKDQCRTRYAADSRFDDLRRRLFYRANGMRGARAAFCRYRFGRSEEHTSELQSQFHLVCRLLLEKKKTK